jgi:isopentenyl phosphate kinase
MNELVFLKLGGSLITDKDSPHSARHECIARIAQEIALGLRANPGMTLLIGHGSGSFGHFAARQYCTRDGVSTPDQWRGFAAVWREAKALNTLVLETLADAGLPVVGFSPFSQALTASHKIVAWDTTQIQLAIKNNLLPLVYGDVVFDTEIGGTILSTEEQFEYLAGQLLPSRILLAGIESGIWKDFPQRVEIIHHITPANVSEVRNHLAASESPDVTGGMRSKVDGMLNLVRSGVCKEVCIFSGLPEGSISNALSGISVGTSISLDQ